MEQRTLQQRLPLKRRLREGYLSSTGKKAATKLIENLLVEYIQAKKDQQKDTEEEQWKR